MIPGWLISLLTFPGVIVHEIAHLLFCRLFGVAVFKVCYFRIGNPCGYVEHEVPRYSWQNIWIGVGPFFINSILGALIAGSVSFPVYHFFSAKPIDYFYIWLGLSIAIHAFPSTGDAKSIWRSLWTRKASMLDRIIGIPLVGFIYLGALGSFIGLDILYGAAVAIILPKIVVRLFI